MGDAAFLKGLTDRQREAALHDGGPLMVLAGPGAGKTHVIVRRIARLVAPEELGGSGVEPESVLALAFTVKAAEQLRERIAAQVGPAIAERVQAHTSHGFGRRLLVRFGDMIGVHGAGERRMMDSAQRRKLLRAIILERGALAVDAPMGIEAAVDRASHFLRSCATDAVTPARIHQWVRDREERLASGAHGLDEAGEAAERAKLEIDRDLAGVFEEFERRRMERGQLTIDDCINATIRLLEKSRQAAAIVRDEVRHIVVDEFQDWNPAQIRMLSLLAPPAREGRRGPDLCVVGDDDQAIFAFRGADERAFQRFGLTWKGARTVALEENFRSQAPVVRAAQAVIERAQGRFDPEKKLRPAAAATKDAASVEGVEVKDANEQGAVIAAMLLADHTARAGARWSDYAVVCRTNTDVNRVSAALELEGIPVASARAPKPADDAGAQDLFAWARLVVDRSMSGEAERLLTRPPLLLPMDELVAWLDERRRGSAGGEPPAFVEWMARARRKHPCARGMLQRLNHLCAFAETHDASAAVREIVRVCDVVHAEALTGAARSARLRAVLTALRFAAEVQEILPAPGGLRELLEHYDDLDDKERTLENVGRDPIDPDGAERERRDENAVEVLTAHKAKGLEFDTVVTAQMWPPHGFPKTAGGGDDGAFEALPQELTGRAEHVRLEEERRIFYVACTRAARRLVLVGKERKTKSSASTDYFLELTHEDREKAPIEVTSGKEWLARGAVEAPEEGEEDAPAPTVGARRWLDAESARAKRRLAQLAHEAESPGSTDGDVDRAAAGLGRAARRLATLGALRRAAEQGREAELPGFVRAGDADEAELRAVVERVRRAEEGVPATRPMEAPLHLSYSRVHDYESCPRCFYVKHVLRVDEPKTDELAVGDLAHRALHAFYTRWRERDGEGAPLEGAEGLRALLRAAEETIARSSAGAGRGGAEARRRLAALMEQYWSKLHVENADVKHLEQAVKVEVELAGSRHTITAKIDRLDQLPDGRWRVIDYKTGRASERLLKPKADDLQMGVYLLALPRLLELGEEESVEGVAEYWMLQTGERGSIEFGGMRRQMVIERLAKAAEGMLKGRFGKGKECKGLCGILGEE